jgi:hypothetical protein
MPNADHVHDRFANPRLPPILIDDEGLNNYLWRFIECGSFVEMQEGNNLPILLAYKYCMILLLVDCLVSSFHFLQTQLVPKLRQEQMTDCNVRGPHLSDRDSHAETSNFDLPPLLHTGIRVSLAAGLLKTTSEGATLPCAMLPISFATGKAPSPAMQPARRIFPMVVAAQRLHGSPLIAT